jgi:hypothetical protein
MAAPILVPPPAEQSEIVYRVLAATARLEQLVVELTRATTLLGRLTQSVLAKAFHGEPISCRDLPLCRCQEHVYRIRRSFAGRWVDNRFDGRVQRQQIAFRGIILPYKKEGEGRR